MPSSLTRVLPFVLGFSPRPPVSVYGTGRRTLNARPLFLRVCLPALSLCPKTLCTVGFRSPYVLQPPHPSGGGSVTSRSRSRLHGALRNINRISIRFPSRVPLRSRLTLVRLALSRKPWAVGARGLTRVVVTHAYIFFSGRSSKPHGSPSRPTGMLPYHSELTESSASAPVLMPGHYPRVTARLVSCYALFK